MEKVGKSYTNLFGSMIMAVAFIVMGFFINQTVSAFTNEQLKIEKQKMMNEIAYQCSQMARASWIDQVTKVEVTEPYQKSFEKCLVDRGWEK